MSFKKVSATVFGYFTVALAGLAVFYVFKDSGSDALNWAQLPIVGGLVGALFQLVRDDAAASRATQMEQHKQTFTFGAQSHMAQVIWNKQVEFCEAYASELDKCIAVLYRDGPAKSALDCANALFAIRRRYAVWLPENLESKLDPFEESLRRVGNSSYIAEKDSRGVNPDVRQQHIDRMYREYAKAMGEKEWLGEVLTEEAGHAVVLNSLKSVLGINDMTALLAQIKGNAVSGLPANDFGSSI